MATSVRYEIARSDVQYPATTEAARITDVESLSSYNWIEARPSRPTIAVPGNPALWSPPAKSSRLQQDHGLVYIAQNTARHPSSPLEPLFRAVYAMRPEFDIRTCDVVTDRNNLRKLLSFVNSRASRYGVEAFTINIEMVKNTALFCRNETKTREFIHPGQFRGYGHEFEKAYTTSQIANSTGHHRIIAYRLANLKVVLRHETDGYVEHDACLTNQRPVHHKKNDLSDMLSALSLSPSVAGNPTKTTSPDRCLVIKKQGREVPLASTLEIKTRASRKPMTFDEVAPQLWISQTPKLVQAYHQGGLFQPCAVKDVAGSIKDWETSEQESSRTLVHSIRKIIDLVRKLGGRATLSHSVDDDRLFIVSSDAAAMLLNDLYEKWEGMLQQQGNEHNEKDRHDEHDGKPMLSRMKAV